MTIRSASSSATASMAHACRPGSANIKATYRYGIGTAGNVNAWQISQLATHPLGLQGVVNPLPASGGADRDSIDQARRNAPLDRDRAGSPRVRAGLRRLRTDIRGHRQASAVRLSDGRTQLVHLTIAGTATSPIDPSSDLYRNLVIALAVVRRSIPAGAGLLAPGEAARHQRRCAPESGLSLGIGRAESPCGAARGLRRRGARSRTTGIPQRGSRDDAGGRGRRSQSIRRSSTRSRRTSTAEAAAAACDDVDGASVRGGGARASGSGRRQPRTRAGASRPADLVYLTPDPPATLILTEIGG